MKEIDHISSELRKKNRKEIVLLSQVYVTSLRFIKEDSENIINRPIFELKNHRKILKHIEYTAENLDAKERFIIINEVMNGATGKWYLEYFSQPAYYRIRTKAYFNFLHCLDN